MNIIRNKGGWIEVICGSMYSGKTEELIRRLRRSQIAKQNVTILKPKIDTRFSENHIVSHSDIKIPSIPVSSASDILTNARDSDVVGIDEAQFFGMELVEACQTLADEGKRVIVAGLDQDYRGEPFEPIPELLAIAEYITKTLAICMVCGNPANKTQRITEDEERVIVGGSKIYEARCRNCYQPPGRK